MTKFLGGLEMWHPRGTPISPDWARRAIGSRVRHVRSGALGVFLGASRCANNGARVRWDNGVEGYVVAAAFELEFIDKA